MSGISCFLFSVNLSFVPGMYDVSRFSFSWGTVAVGCVVHTWFFFFISSPPPFQVVLSIARAILNTRGIVRLLSTAAVVSLQSYTSFMNPRDRTTNVRRFELSGQRVQAGYISCGKYTFFVAAVASHLLLSTT